VSHDSILGTTWVHVFEKDTSAGAVYWPLDADIPLSRRPRTRLQLSADGSARVWVPGPADRPEAQDATWSEEGDAIVVRSSESGPAAGRVFRIVQHTADQLIVQK
jgi:hypothetical protein